mgnify:CR=1 FL=1
MQSLSNAIAEFKDPFRDDCIKAVHFHCYARGVFSTERFIASVEFENGKTEGTQKFDADSFKSLVSKVDQFIKEVKNDRS